VDVAPFPPPTKTLTPQHHIELANRLLDCAIFKNRASHDLVLSFVPNSGAITYHPTNRAEAFNFVRTCAVPGMIEQLVAAVEAIKGDSLPLRRVMEFLQGI
jgi:hypothetical protein